MPRIAYVNGHFLPLEKATISIQDRGFMFADGIYEVTAVMDGKLVDFENHMARLWRCLGEIGLASPVTREEMLHLHRELIRLNEMEIGTVYLQITRGVADRDFLFPKDTTPTLAMFTQARLFLNSPAVQNGIKVMSLPDMRWKRCDIKSIALLAQVLAKQAANVAGCQEAWMLDGEEITEGGSSTAFIITKAGTLITRPISRAILPGVTRKAVLDLLGAEHLQFEERAFTLSEAYEAAEAFMTSATSFVTSIVEIDGRKIGAGVPGNYAAALRKHYINAVRANLL